MKKLIALLIVIIVCFSLCACQKFDAVTEAETSTVGTTQKPCLESFSETPNDVVSKAIEAYAAYIAPFSGKGEGEDEGITSALVVDLDKNKVPEVIFTYYGYHNMYILSYGENNGLSVITPLLYSSTPAEVYFSDDNGVLYYTDSGHTQGTSWYHEGACFKATSEGFETLGTVSGDTWDDVSEDIWQDEELFAETDDKYDKDFAESIKKIVGEGNFSNFFDMCEKENAEKYLEEMLLTDLTAKKEEYSKFKETAISAIGTDPISIDVADYDRNGTYEAFALVGRVLNEDDPMYEGEVWFVSDDGKAKIVYDNFEYWSDGEVFECQYNNYYQIHLASGSSNPSAVWTVSDNECKEIKIFHESGVENFTTVSLNSHSNSVVATVNGFDAVLEDINGTDSGTGHTHKPYFYYDTPDGIKEYGGIIITEAQLETLGGSAYIDLVKDEGYTIREIYIRENGIININFYKYDGDYLYNCNYINLKMMNHQISALNEDLYVTGIPNELDEIMCEGFYVAASVPKLATYPNVENYL